jgi:DNA-binding response OmpR family regulator
VNSNRPTILVVEDEPITRNLIVDVLTRQGWLVFEADTVTEAQIVCSALNDERIDVLIVAEEAFSSPDGDFADRILTACPGVKILHLSAAPSLEPGSSYLQKPFTGGQLMDAVESLLRPRTQ